jgi:hypothetical protein
VLRTRLEHDDNGTPETTRRTSQSTPASRQLMRYTFAISILPRADSPDSPKRDERLMDIGPLVIPQAKAAKLIEPSKCALHDPTATGPGHSYAPCGAWPYGHDVPCLRQLEPTCHVAEAVREFAACGLRAAAR